MALKVEGRLIGVTVVPSVAEDKERGRDAKESHLKLDVYDKRGRNKENKMIEVKAPLSLQAQIEQELDEEVSYPVNAYPWQMGQGEAKVSFALITEEK